MSRGAITGDAQTVAGSRGRAACSRVAGIGESLTTALRRAVPFIARMRVRVSAEIPRCAAFAEILADVTIVHAAPFSVGPPPLHGLVLIDESAMARLLDGVLGGDGAPVVGMPALTSAQTALAARVSAALVRGFGEVIASRLGLAVEPASTQETSGTAVLTTIALDGGGRILVAIPLAVLAAEEPEAREETVNPTIAAAMRDVEVEIVAELGTLRLPLEAIAGLQVGDVLRLTMPLDERVRVCAGGATLFRGRPTARGDVVAIALERRVA